MGQKVNPNGLRVGVIKNWDSRWFAKDNVFGDLLVEDYNIRKYLEESSQGRWAFLLSKLSVLLRTLRFLFNVLVQALLLVRAARKLKSYRLMLLR